MTLGPSHQVILLPVAGWPWVRLQGAIVAARDKAKRLKGRTVENVGALTLAMGNHAAQPAPGHGTGSGHGAATGSGSGTAGGISLDELSTKVSRGDGRRGQRWGKTGRGLAQFLHVFWRACRSCMCHTYICEPAEGGDLLLVWQQSWGGVYRTNPGPQAAVLPWTPALTLPLCSTNAHRWPRCMCAAALTRMHPSARCRWGGQGRVAWKGAGCTADCVAVGRGPSRPVGPVGPGAVKWLPRAGVGEGEAGLQERTS